MLARELSKAYWPNLGKNKSADVAIGNDAVDKLTIGQLAAFYAEVQTGPTYVMVTRRVQELLSKFPPHIEDKRARAAAALQVAMDALKSLNAVAEEVL